MDTSLITPNYICIYFIVENESLYFAETEQHCSQNNFLGTYFSACKHCMTLLVKTGCFRLSRRGHVKILRACVTPTRSKSARQWIQCCDHVMSILWSRACRISCYCCCLLWSRRSKAADLWSRGFTTPCIKGFAHRWSWPLVRRCLNVSTQYMHGVMIQ